LPFGATLFSAIRENNRQMCSEHNYSNLGNEW